MSLSHASQPPVLKICSPLNMKKGETVFKGFVLTVSQEYQHDQSFTFTVKLHTHH